MNFILRHAFVVGFLSFIVLLIGTIANNISMLIGLIPSVLIEVVWLYILSITKNNKKLFFDAALYGIAFKVLLIPPLIVYLATLEGMHPATVVFTSFFTFIVFMSNRLFLQHAEQSNG